VVWEILDKFCGFWLFLLDVVMGLLDKINCHVPDLGICMVVSVLRLALFRYQI
jgi:hypothetical protein